MSANPTPGQKPKREHPTPRPKSHETLVREMRHTIYALLEVVRDYEETTQTLLRHIDSCNADPRNKSAKLRARKALESSQAFAIQQEAQRYARR